MNKTVRRILMLVLLAVFVVSAAMFGRDMIFSTKEKKANQALADQVHAIEAEMAQEAQETGTDPVETAQAQGETLPQYLPLFEQNSDMAGWLTVPDTPIDYPVMYTPDNRDFYLRKAFDKSYSISGTLFIATPWSDEHTLIYGHHMKNDTMFGSLQKYEDPAYWETHKTVIFSTLTQRREYEVMACFRGQAVVKENNFQYWDYADLSDPERFQEYVDQVMEAALYSTDVTARPGDELLTMSTCSYHVSDGRFAVVCKRVN